MKKTSSILLMLLIAFSLFGCQSSVVSSEITISSETASTLSEELTEMSYEHIQFKTTQELLDYLKQNSGEKEIKGAKISNLIKDNQITVYEPTFTIPDGFYLNAVEIWTIYGAYVYVTDAYVNRLEKRIQSMQTAAQTMLYPESYYKIPDSTEKSISSETNSFSGSEADFIFEAENMLIIQWCTEKWENPLGWIFEIPTIKPLGKDENPKYYYTVNDSHGTPIDYSIYWEVDGHYCYARIPATLFSEENVAKICSFKPVTVPLG